jgi:hypothetical protein
MSRALKPRPAMVVRPSFVSNETSFALFGIVPRKFLERIAPECEHVTRIGKTVLVPIDEAERVVLAMAIGDRAEGAVPENDGDEQPHSVADVLAQIGREVAR